MSNRPSGKNTVAVQLFEWQPLWDRLDLHGASHWASQLRTKAAAAVVAGRHGLLPQWKQAWADLPVVADAGITVHDGAVCVTGSLPDARRSELEARLRMFHPWRKGPFQILGTRIDTEWRSNLKWDRLAPHVNFGGRSVLDVGCGNGYYGWRMLQSGAALVIGLDPFLLYVMQFEVLRRYAGSQSAHFVLPVGDDALDAVPPLFDIVLSMGVLYHHATPPSHLQRLLAALKPGGTLVLETLIIRNAEPVVLEPRGRYAMMRNVFAIPSIPALLDWISEAGFIDARVADVAKTTTNEQRRTDWMTFQSLPDFLNPDDPSQTIEGHPAPVRAMVLATKPPVS